MKKKINFVFNFFFFLGGGAYLCKLLGGHAPPPRAPHYSYGPVVSSLIARWWVRPQTLWRLWRKALIGGLVPDAYL